VADLEQAGIGIIQIDEPAVREGLPLRRSRWDAYLDWATAPSALGQRGGRRDADPHPYVLRRVQRHPAADRRHGCRRDHHRDQPFGHGAAGGFGQFRYPNEIGPGVYDIHSPRVPAQAEMVRLLQKPAR
jgi:5-methyltetrahydropteroyltriglutamate--homocysteine methyltransferase